MGGAHIIWKLWFFMCALWMALIAAAIGWLAGPAGWADALISAVLYGVAPIFAGTVLIYWSFQFAPWRLERHRRSRSA